ncbi:MAG TPA: hypothetical protein VHD89_02395 [Rhodanobacteraceae bacterium]|jgi:hypothetical protein|nr:hypothetical protein [Rhodanobacteraceae bacterium]
MHELLDVFVRHPRESGLRRQDAGANIRKANGPKGKPQDAASQSRTSLTKMDPGLRRDDKQKEQS